MDKRHLHFIAIGGAAMHNIALDALAAGNRVTGSDDEIYEPSLGRLKKAGIAPATFGWFPEKVEARPDAVILGMHARADNPELLRAIELGIPVYSYPSYVYERSVDKKRIVVAGSHGKTTTTAMILHVLQRQQVSFDYLVGAQLPGFDRMVRLSDAPLIVIEGDEYLSSAIDRRPKIHHYHPHITVLTGIAWDHINVFPTFDDYRRQFDLYLDMVEPGGHVIFDQDDPELVSLLQSDRPLQQTGYGALPCDNKNRVLYQGKAYEVAVIGKHNFRNMHAALHVCLSLGITAEDFFASTASFTGASKRLQPLQCHSGRHAYLDFAHAPSKVKATTDAFCEWFHDHPVTAILELHTFSSLSASFLPQYKHCLNSAERVVVFVHAHTIAMKQMPPVDPVYVRNCFDHPHLTVITDTQELASYIATCVPVNKSLLLMSSGTFGGLDLKSL